MRSAHADHVARSVHEVDYDRLLNDGIQAILYDLENTLCRWQEWELDERTRALLCRLGEEGVALAVLTNAALPPGHPLVRELEGRGVVVVTRARKPLRRGFQTALRRLGIAPGQAAMVGDQVLTDILGGKRAGLVTVLVDPLGPEESRLTKINRRLERLLGRRSPTRGASAAP